METGAIKLERCLVILESGNMEIHKLGWDEETMGRMTKKELDRANAAANKFLRSKGEKIGWKETVIPKSIQKSAKKKD